MIARFVTRNGLEKGECYLIHSHLLLRSTSRKELCLQPTSPFLIRNSQEEKGSDFIGFQQQQRNIDWSENGKRSDNEFRSNNCGSSSEKFLLLSLASLFLHFPTRENSQHCTS